MSLRIWPVPRKWRPWIAAAGSLALFFFFARKEPGHFMPPSDGPQPAPVTADIPLDQAPDWFRGLAGLGG